MAKRPLKSSSHDQEGNEGPNYGLYEIMDRVHVLFETLDSRVTRHQALSSNLKLLDAAVEAGEKLQKLYQLASKAWVRSCEE